MKRIIDFLEKNNIEYEMTTYGNPYYYNDNFKVSAVTVKFDYELTDNISGLQEKENLFLRFMKRKRMQCIGYSGRSGRCIPWYSVFNASDFKRQQEHEARIQEDTEKFWHDEHRRREAENLRMAM